MKKLRLTERDITYYNKIGFVFLRELQKSAYFAQHLAVLSKRGIF